MVNRVGGRLLRGDVASFAELSSLHQTLDQIARIHKRGILSAADARDLGLHVSRPYLDGLRQPLLSHEVYIDEAADHLNYLDMLIDNSVLPRRQLGPIRRLLQAVPPPALETDQTAERQQLLSHLQQLRRTGAITEDELARERSRLLSE